MTYFDIFNGDADGICALQQLRLHHPLQSTLVTATKREINLVERAVFQSGDHITALDISLEKNIDAVLAALECGVTIDYYDHHFPGDIPQYSKLKTSIDTSADICTSMIVNRELKGAFSAWAIVGAYGDNLIPHADAMATTDGFTQTDRDRLFQLGTALNYNGYGTSLADLHFHPADLYRALSPYVNPLGFVEESSDFTRLYQGYKEDIALGEAVKTEISKPNGAIYILPDQPWARRISGVLGNQLATQYPDRAHALLTVLDNGDFRVSVRAPLNNKTGADDLCRSFATGGGRKGAAGINQLNQNDYDLFVSRFFQQYL
jgi:hypothetical protein